MSAADTGLEKTMTDQPETGHTVEKIGGTSMTRSRELMETLFLRGGDAPYGRIFVVSAYSGVTDALLEHKKTSEPGVYAAFANDDGEMRWAAALDAAAALMRERHEGVLEHKADLAEADAFVRERIEGVRSCLIDLRRLGGYGHFRIDDLMMTVRELLSGLGEAHSAFCTHLLLRRAGVAARFVDLTGWRDEDHPELSERIRVALEDIDVASELPIVTGYAHCDEGLMGEYDRGYSEITFARIAALTGAREAIIHKEFNLSSADPKLVGVENARRILRTNYDVADQLANTGMEAIHPGAAKMLRQAGIPLRVANAFRPGDEGTLIDEAEAEAPGVEILTAIPVFALELFEQDMLGVKGYDAKALEALTRHNAWIVSKSSNGNTITHYVDAPLKTVRRVERDLTEAYPAASVTSRRLAIVSVIGRDISGLGIARRALDVLAEAGIEPVAIQNTTRRTDLQLIVKRDEADEAVKALHRGLIQSGDACLTLAA